MSTERPLLYLKTLFFQHSLSMHLNSQPLDLTTNKWAKGFMKDKFSEWYSDKIRKKLENGVPLEDIEIKFPLSVMKPLQASWIIDLYNAFTGPHGRKVFIPGWKKSGISDAVKLGSTGLPNLDPFHDIDPMVTYDEVNGLPIVEPTPN